MGGIVFSKKQIRDASLNTDSIDHLITQELKFFRTNFFSKVIAVSSFRLLVYMGYVKTSKTTKLLKTVSLNISKTTVDKNKTYVVLQGEVEIHLCKALVVSQLGTDKVYSY